MMALKLLKMENQARIDNLDILNIEEGYIEAARIDRKTNQYKNNPLNRIKMCLMDIRKNKKKFWKFGEKK